MFQIKICGVTNFDDALMIADAGADAVGLNFYEKSVRQVDLSAARRIASRLSGRLELVGLFVNADHQHVRRVCDQVGLDVVQLHGDEPPEFVCGLQGLAVVRAFRLGGSCDLANIQDYLRQCEQCGCSPRAVLLDAYDAAHYGGTGKLVNWNRAADVVVRLGGWRVVLAGGLTASNVADAIRVVHPAAVDVSSGVESKPGVKSAELVRRFVQAATEAFRQPDTRISQD